MSFVASFVATTGMAFVVQETSPQASGNLAGDQATFHDLELQMADLSNDQAFAFFERNLKQADGLRAMQQASLVVEVLEQREDWGRAIAARQQIAKLAAEKTNPRHWSARLAVELAEHTELLSTLENSRQAEYLKLRKRILNLEDWMEQNPWDIDLKRTEWEEIAEEIEPLLDSDNLVVSTVSLRHLQTVLAQSRASLQFLAELQRLEKTFQTRLGTSPFHAQCHNLISQAFRILGKNDKALGHGQLALSSFKESGIEASDIQYNLASIHLGSLYFLNGKVPQAQLQFQQVIADCEAHGLLHQLVCLQAHYRLAAHHRMMRDAVRKGVHLKSADVILAREAPIRTGSGEERVEFLRHYMERLGGLQEMGSLYCGAGDYERARRALQLDAKLKQERNTNPTEIVLAYNNLAVAEVLSGEKLEEAEKHIEYALSITEGWDLRYLYGDLMSLQAIIAKKQDDLPKALGIYRSLNDYYRNMNDPVARQGPLAFDALTAMCEIEWRLEQKKQAYETCQEFLDTCFLHCVDQLPQMPVDGAQEGLLNFLRRGMENLLAMADEEDPATLKKALEWTTAIKGLGTESEKQVLAQMRELASSAEHSVTVTALSRARGKIVHVLLHDYRRISKRMSEIQSIQKELESLHNRLLAELNRVRKNHPLSLSKPPIDRLLSRIPAGTAYVDFWTASEPQFWTSSEELARARQLVAMVVWRPSQSESPKIRLVRLGNYSDVASEIGEWQTRFAALDRLGIGASAAQQNGVRTKLLESSQHLHGRLWDKIATHIGQMEQVVISPVEALWQIPFAALHDHKQYLIERQQIAVVHNARQFVQILERPNKRASNPLIVGGLDYGQAEQREDAEETAFAFRSLRHSRNEMESVDQSMHRWNSVSRLSDKGATESAVVAALTNPEHDMAHLATHAFVLKMDIKNFVDPDQSGEQANNQGRPFELVLAQGLQQRRINAFFGIALSGANRSKINDPDDQILSAEEIELLDLSHLRFVALSGCSTSRGFSYRNEGIFGLQRSFYLAGVQSSLGSLWEIDDQRSEKFMELFYSHYRQNETAGIAAALAMTQRELIKAGEPISSWAAWQIFGDWR